jgi:ribose transport system permease protein
MIDATKAAGPRRRALLRHTATAGDLATRAIAQYGLIVVFVVIVAFFSIINTDVFFTSENARTIATTNAVVAIVALAAMVPLVTGQFDLSLGFQVGLAQALCAGLMIKQGLSPGLACLIVIAWGAFFGLCNGLIVTALGINAFIATLGTGTLALGLTQWYTDGESIFGSMSQTFLDAGRDDVAGIPLPMIYAVVICTVLWLVLQYTTPGRAAFATGGNPRAALLAGVRVARVTVASFVAAGVLSSIAGILSVTILGSANPDVGTSFLLPAFAGAFLGATSIRPGRYNAWGTLWAIYLLAVGITGLQQIGAEFFIQQFFYGGALLIAVALAGLAAKRRREAAAEATAE